MTEDTREDAAARLAARGEPVTLVTITEEQRAYAYALRHKRLKIARKPGNGLNVRRVGKIEK